MAIYRGDTKIRRVFKGETEIRRIYKGDVEVFRMLSGISNLQFGSLAANLSLTSTTTYQDAATLDITPSRDDVVIGLLVSPYRLLAGVTRHLEIRVVRGSTEIHEPLPYLHDAYSRQLFIDKPASTSEQTYTLQGKRFTSNDTAAQMDVPTTLMAFEFPDTVVADIVSANISIPDGTWTTVATVDITPPSTSAAVLFQTLPLGSSHSMSVRLRRGSTVLVTAEGGILHRTNRVGDRGEFPTNFEDWVDEPSSTSPQTYTLQAMSTGTRTIYKGSYLRAEAIE